MIMILMRLIFVIVGNEVRGVNRTKNLSSITGARH